jgi:NMD protein affecting ribosome stability and mRNA decay
MGLFDTVLFTCPECGEKVEKQSKAGDCYLAEISQSQVPIEIAQDILGQLVKCDDCNFYFHIIRDTEPINFVKLKLG